LRLSLKIVDAGFPDGYAKSFVKKFTPRLDSMTESDRLIVESVIPEILSVGENCWYPEDGDRIKNDTLDELIMKIMDPSRRPQEALNRE